MAKPTLIIGVGGTGQRVLLRIKERFLEAFDEVPSGVILFELDTDAELEIFHDVTLYKAGDIVKGRPVAPQEAEFFHVSTENASQTIDQVFPLKRRGLPEWQWINEVRLDRTLNTPDKRVIKTGAGTCRPVGRIALFMRYSDVYAQIEARIRKLVSFSAAQLKERNEGQTQAEYEFVNIFIVGSSAGGSGAGMGLDVVRMVRHIVSTSFRGNKIPIMPVFVGANAFGVEENSSLNANTYAVLRELDRLGAIAGSSLVREVPPVMDAPHPVNHYRQSSAPADMTFLFDRADRLGNTRGIDINRNANNFLNLVVTPTIADFIVAMTDRFVAGKFSTASTDFGQNYLRKHPFNNNAVGYFPYSSIGTYTLIFPERDIRKSAGYRLLNDIFNENLLHPKSEQINNVPLEKLIESFPYDHLQPGIPPASPTLIGERNTTTDGYSAKRIANERLINGQVFTKVRNNPFIQTIVNSSMQGELGLPADSMWNRLFGRENEIKRVMRLIGIPNSMEVRDAGNALDRIADALDQKLTRSIDQMQACRNAQAIRDWRYAHFGEGQLGNERNGLWESWFLEEDSINLQKDDFRSVLRDLTTEVLNDSSMELSKVNQRIPYRLLFMRYLLAYLKRHLAIVSQGASENSPSLISQFYQRQTDAHSDAASSIEEIEAEAMHGQRLSEYQKRNKRYAECKKQLIGKMILDKLCQDLSNEIDAIDKRLQHVISLFVEISKKLGDRREKHEQNRLDKAVIPTRKYLVKKNDNEKFGESRFEKGLYDEYAAKGLASFLTNEAWSWVKDSGLLHMECPFGFPPDKGSKWNVNNDVERPKLIEQICERAINWAGTKDGNYDRDDKHAKPPFVDMASPSKITLAQQLDQYYGAAFGGMLAVDLTSEHNLAVLYPLITDWPKSRLQLLWGIPSPASGVSQSNGFFNDVMIGMNGVKNKYTDRVPSTTELENPRFAFACEMALGFDLSIANNTHSYERVYRRDTNLGYALHTMPEEDVASTYFETQFDPRSEIYPNLGLNMMTLAPPIVDILRNTKHLSLFIQAFATKLIGPLPPEERRKINAPEGPSDLFIYPTERDIYRIRLSRLSQLHEISTIAGDLVPSNDAIPEVIREPKVVSRLRMLYALRVFVLQGSCIDATDRKKIDYEQLGHKADEILRDISSEEREKFYKDLWRRFLDYYLEYGDHRLREYEGKPIDRKGPYPILAHLGLVLARTAYDLAVIARPDDQTTREY